MEWWEISLIVLGAVIVIFAVVAIIAYAKKGALGKRAEKVVVKDGVRYSKSENILTENGNMHITHNKGDIVLMPGKKLVASIKGKLLPGKYTVLSSDGNAEKLNIRVGTFVREYAHGSEIVVAEGDEVTAVSHTVVLR